MFPFHWPSLKDLVKDFRKNEITPKRNVCNVKKEQYTKNLVILWIDFKHFDQGCLVFKDLLIALLERTLNQGRTKVAATQ